VLYINEWLPNPAGNDASGEFVELYNSGAAAVRLDGYSLSVGGKKQTSLKGLAVPADGYLTLYRDKLRLALKNTDGAVFLYGPDGALVDRGQFSGAAPQGQSFSRNDYGTAPVQHFVFTFPSPGTDNRTVSTEVAANPYPLNVPLGPQLPTFSFVILSIGASIFFLGFFIYATRKNRDISDLFFGRDEEAGRKDGEGARG
jgi:hypothetical protein